jgi:hypothetical protein
MSHINTMGQVQQQLVVKRDVNVRTAFMVRFIIIHFGAVVLA